MRNFGAAERMTKMMERLGVADGEALEHSFLNKSVESAQKRVEQRNYMWRKHVLDYDDVMNKQREIVYGYRNEVLSTENPREMIYDILEEVIATRAHEFLDPDAEGVTHPDELFAWMNASFPLGLTAEAAKLEERPIDDTIAFLIDKVKATYEDKASRERPEYLDHMERQIILGAIDKMWQEHLYNMDSLREGVRLRAQGQKDPLVEYKSEAYDLFITLMESIKSEAISNLFKSTTNLDAFEDFLASLPQFESSDENQEGGTSLPEIGFDGMPSDLLSALREQVSRAREQQSARQAEPGTGPGRHFRRHHHWGRLQTSRGGTQTGHAQAQGQRRAPQGRSLPRVGGNAGPRRRRRNCRHSGLPGLRGNHGQPGFRGYPYILKTQHITYRPWENGIILFPRPQASGQPWLRSLPTNPPMSVPCWSMFRTSGIKSLPCMWNVLWWIPRNWWTPCWTWMYCRK